MRIAISGSACQGKTTFINDFVKTWPKYTRSAESYRNLIKEENIGINKKVSADGQYKILNCLIDDLQKTAKGDKILFDRCPLDNIVYSLWSLDKQSSDIDKKFIDKCIPLVRESMKHLDIIFYIPITRAAPIEISPKDTREIDKQYIEEIDNIFKAITYQMVKVGRSPFFPEEDFPPIIEIFGSPEERIEMVKLYLDEQGDLIHNEESILDPKNLEDMQQLLEAQEKIKQDDDVVTRLKKKFLLDK
jgi:predicted ATPase